MSTHSFTFKLLRTIDKKAKLEYKLSDLIFLLILMLILLLICSVLSGLDSGMLAQVLGIRV